MKDHNIYIFFVFSELCKKVSASVFSLLKYEK